jgi:DNA modification methylase
VKSSTLGANSGGRSEETHRRSIEASREPYRDTCGKCGARRIDAQLGLEPTPEAYVDAMVDVFRHVRRVLRDDGTLWLNIGDSYAASGPAGGAGKQHTNAGSVDVPVRKPTGECKPKDLVGIPWMLAFALRADGWWLRQDIIWSKPNPMPESVRDRCTKAHEYLFLLSKSARYWYDQEAISERALNTPGGRLTGSKHKGIAEGSAQSGTTIDCAGEVETRNKRSVWHIATTAFPEAHFATFPPALVEPCILAGSREGDTVLDPFIGSGTTAMVARNLGRRAIGIDLNAEYLAMAKRRVGEQLALLDGAR